MRRNLNKITHNKDLHVGVNKISFFHRRHDTVSRRQSLHGFTFVEIIIVVIILAIISLVAVPMYSSAGATQVRAAADMIASDIEYAKSMAITAGANYSVVFDTSAESYQLVDSGGSMISHPVRIGQNYSIDFAGDSRLDKVDIVSADFNSSATVTFNYLGAPVDGGTVSLSAEGFSLTVNVEDVTGYVSIQ